MSEHKRFKAFRSTLNESEYKETLTGYPNRGIDTDVGPANANLLTKVNAVLNSLNRFTHQNVGDALIKVRTRLNLFMLDFPWTPWMWQGNQLGAFAVPVTLYGRVDGVDGVGGGIRFDGRANPNAGLQEFTLSVTVETAEDGLYRVTAKLAPRVEVVPEGVEEDGDAVTEDYQTDARAREMANKIEKHEQKAQSGYAAKMTQSGKAAARGRRQEAKHDAASRRLMKRDQKEQDSPRTYGRGGKLVKRGSRREVKEEVEAMDEMAQTKERAAEVKTKLGKMHKDLEKDQKKVQSVYDRYIKKHYGTPTGAREKAKYNRRVTAHSKNYYDPIDKLAKQDERERKDDTRLYGKGGKVVAKRKVETKTIRGNWKPVKEDFDTIEEMHKPGDTVKVPHKGKMVKGKIVRHDKGGSSKAAQHGGGYVVDVGEHGSITVPSHKVVKEEWKSLKKTKADLNAIRASGKKVSVQHGEGDTLYRVSKAKKSVKEEAEQIDELSKATKDAYVAKRGSQLQRMTTGLDRYRNLLTGKQQANAVKGIKQAMSMKAGMKEELIGGQKRLDVNKNKKLDAQDFALLRAKKKPVKEYTEMMPGIPLQSPDPASARADKSGKGKRFHKGALKAVEEAVGKTKKKAEKKPNPHAGAANAIGRQKAIKRTIEKHGMRSFGDW